MRIHLMVLIMGMACMPENLLSSLGTEKHDSGCYSQGLSFLNESHLMESCGWYNGSYFHLYRYEQEPFTLEKVWKSQKPYQMNVFFQGITAFHGYIYILTWRQHIVYRLNSSTLELVDQLHWDHEGWGLANNGSHMFITTGEPKIYLVDEDLHILQTQTILNQKGKPVSRLNELEFVDGYLYINIYLDRRIVKVDYEEGLVLDSYDGLNLIKKQGKLRYDEVLNGIAYMNGTFIFTGKNWKYFHKITLL